MSKEVKLELLGKPLTLNEKGDTYTMAKKDYDEVLEGLGVTKEVREVVDLARQTIVKAAAPFLKDASLKDDGATKFAKFGQGNDSMEFRFDAKREHSGVKPGTNEQYHSVRYGVLSVTTNFAICREIRKEGALMSEIENDCKAFFEKKKK